MSNVFATCVYVDPAGVFAFYRVEGTVKDDGMWSRLHDAKRQFPNRGTIRVIHSDLRIAPSRIGNFGVFELAEAENFNAMADDSNAAKFRAVRIVLGIHQLYSVKLSSMQTEEVAVLLKAGINLLGELTSRTRIYLQLSDGVVSGPFEMKLKDPKSSIYIPEEQTNLAAKPAWHSSADLRTFHVDINQRGYGAAFICPILPAPDFFLDFAPIDYTIRKVLDTLNNQKALDETITKAQRSAIAHALARIESDADTRARIDTVLRQLGRAERVEPEFSRLISECIKHPVIENRISREIEQEKQQAIAKLASERSAEQAAINRLQTERTELAKEIKRLEVQKDSTALEIAKLDSEKTEAVAKIEEAIKQQFEKAAKNTAVLLSEIAILRPLLTPAPPANPTPQTFSAERALSVSFIEKESEVLPTPTAAHQHLARNFQRIGFSPSLAARWSSEVLAAIFTGEAVSVRGSMASVVANVIAESCFGHGAVSVDVPIGYLDLLSSRHLKQPVLSSIDAWGLIVQGANRSCLDGYGGELIEQVLARSCGIARNRIHPIVVLSLREGPSCLLPTPRFSEIGPVFHTDAIAWRAATGEPIAPGRLACSYECDDAVVVETDLDEIHPLLGEHRSAAFLANIKRALRALMLTRALPLTESPRTELVHKQARQSLACWWILPFLAAHGVSAERALALDILAQGDDVFVSHRGLIIREESTA